MPTLFWIFIFILELTKAVFFIMMVLFIPSITVSAESLGETVNKDTAEDLQAVDYENNEIIESLLAPSRYSMSDKFNKKVMSFEDAFADVQAQIGEIIQRVADSTPGAESKGADFYTYYGVAFICLCRVL